MQRLYPAALIHGVIGGIVAGAVVACWFLVLDVAGGEPLATPAALARAVLGSEPLPGSARLVATYTLLHFGAFALLGLAAAWFLGAIGVMPGLLVGAVFGVGVLDAIYYGALLVTGVDVLGVLPGTHVLAANLAGGMALMAYLHHVTRPDSPLGPAVLRGHEVLARGIVTGLIGAAVVAVWFLALDAVLGAPFRTPAALGSLVFFGASSPADVRVEPGVLAAYTVLHVAAFAAVGLALVWVAERLERVPAIWLMVVLAFVILEGVFLATVASVGTWVLGAVSWWAVGVGNLLAVAAMGRWIWRTHPRLREELVEKQVETWV